jgi:transcriptional regulator with XRE-family HTH domain
MNSPNQGGITMKLSDKLIELRKAKGWSQEDFAEKLDVSRQAISRWENGTALPDAQNILRISKLFCVTSDYLLNDDYVGEIDVPTTETTEETATKEITTEEAEPLVQKKKHPYWYMIPAICFVILVACVMMNVLKGSNTPTNEVHPHPALITVKENEIAPTCAAEGSYDEVIYCADCDKEILRTTKSVAKLAHTLSNSIIEMRLPPLVRPRARMLRPFIARIVMRWSCKQTEAQKRLLTNFKIENVLPVEKPSRAKDCFICRMETGRVSLVAETVRMKTSSSPLILQTEKR